MIAIKLDILSVTEPYLNLRKVGKYYKSICPFHSENHPSFILDSVRQRYHCFGCGADGDSIQFVMSYHKLSFKEALNFLGINGKPYKPNRKETKKRELVNQFKQWCAEYHDDLCSLIRCLWRAKQNVKSIEEMETLAKFYHQEPVWLHRMEVLQSNDNMKKIELYREVKNGE